MKFNVKKLNLILMMIMNRYDKLTFDEEIELKRRRLVSVQMMKMT